MRVGCGGAEVGVGFPSGARLRFVCLWGMRKGVVDMVTTKRRLELALASRREKALADREPELVALAKVDAALAELHQARVAVGLALKEALEIMPPRTLTRETGLKASERKELLALAEVSPTEDHEEAAAKETDGLQVSEDNTEGSSTVKEFFSTASYSPVNAV